MKLTPWYPGHVKPVRVGVYERDYADNLKCRRPRFCYWDGIAWNCHGTTKEHAEIFKDTPSAYQFLEWRGIAKEPK